MKKPRSDSKLANLPEYQRDQVIAWLLDDGFSYETTKELLHQDYNVQTSVSALAGFYQHFCRPLRLRRCAQAAQDLPELAGGLTQDWDAPSIALVKQTYFEILSSPSADPKQLAVFAMQIADINRGKLEVAKLKFQRQKTAATLRMKRRELALSKRKFETKAADLALKFAKEIKTIAADRGLNADAKIEQVRQRLFGFAPATATEATK